MSGESPRVPAEATYTASNGDGVQAVDARHRELGRSAWVGRYVLLERLGVGGMGAVFKAYDPSLDRAVALKLLHRGEASEPQRLRFQREAQAIARLRHPNVVAVYDVGDHDGEPYIAMEFVRGGSLAGWLKTAEQREVNAIVRMFCQAAAGLAAAHAAGMVHRDFKPSNVLLDDDGTVRVADFGLARMMFRVDPGDVDTAISGWSSSDLGHSMTHTGALMGTPAYMAPEQLRGGEVDARSDQFAFCVSLHQALTKTLPERSENGSVSLDFGASRVPPGLQRILRRGVSPEPGARFDSMRALSQALAAELRDDQGIEARRRRRRRRTVLAFGALMAAAVPGAFWYQSAAQRGQLCTGAERELAEVWNATTRDNVQAALIATDLSYAEATAARVATALDDYARAWAEMFGDACEATQVRGEQSAEVMDLRMACLRSRLREVDALTDILERADVEVVAKASQAVADLDPIARCADIEALTGPTQRMRPPESNEQQAKVDAVRDALVVAKSLVRTGQYDEGLRLAEQALQNARASSYLPVEAEILHLLSIVQIALGQYTEAADASRAAYELASACYHDEVVADSANYRVWILGETQHDYHQATQWARLAQSALSSPTVSDRTRTNAFHNIASVALAQGDLEKALDLLGQGLALQSQAAEPLGTNASRIHLAIGTVLDLQGDYDQGLSHHLEALRIMEALLGPEHPRTANSLNNAGLALAELARYDEALTYLHRALEVKRKTLAVEHPSLASTLNVLGHVSRERGHYPAALSYYREALAIRTKALGPDHVWVASTLHGMGAVFLRRGQFREAEEHLRRAIAIREPLGPHPDLAVFLADLARVAHSTGELTEALGFIERALAICNEMVCEPRNRGATLLTAAQIVVASGGDHTRALALARQARDILQQSKWLTNELAAVDEWLGQQEHE